MLAKILVPDPAKRMTVPQIQDHVWYRKDLPPGVAEMNDNLPMPGSGLQVSRDACLALQHWCLTCCVLGALKGAVAFPRPGATKGSRIVGGLSSPPSDVLHFGCKPWQHSSMLQQGRHPVDPGQLEQHSSSCPHLLRHLLPGCHAFPAVLTVG